MQQAALRFQIYRALTKLEPSKEGIVHVEFF
jgi:hypothetical protein